MTLFTARLRRNQKSKSETHRRGTEYLARHSRNRVGSPLRAGRPR
jgi:hypothetical protein